MPNFPVEEQFFTLVIPILRSVQVALTVWEVHRSYVVMLRCSLPCHLHEQHFILGGECLKTAGSMRCGIALDHTASICSY
jgi:hypothetical protein